VKNEPTLFLHISGGYPAYATWSGMHAKEKRTLQNFKIQKYSYFNVEALSVTS
jgi:hypothetical protein